jgi:hypothetical protein
MPIKNTAIPNEPILLSELIAPFDPVKDVETLKQDLGALYQRVQGPISLITSGDIELNFSQMMISLSTITRGEYKFTDLPLTMYSLSDNNSPIIKIMMDAISKGMYGKITIRFVKTVDEALTAIRAGYK